MSHFRVTCIAPRELYMPSSRTLWERQKKGWRFISCEVWSFIRPLQNGPIKFAKAPKKSRETEIHHPRLIAMAMGEYTNAVINEYSGLCIPNN